LLVEVRSGWKGRRPRLAYISDGGWQPEEYYRGVLRQMADPGRPGQVLCWQRVLESASYHRNQQRLRGGRQRAFWKAYCYLWKRRQQMAYARYRREGLPIGSGVTEAGCQVVLSQRLKRSGMGWGLPGGQVVLTLRVVWLSGVGRRVWDAHLAEPVNGNLDSYEACLHPQAPLAA
jgi:hypothetical protein